MYPSSYSGSPLRGIAPGGNASMLSVPPQTLQQELPPQLQEQQLDQKQRAPGQRPQKVRTSCDSCASAKVRCSKERPRCDRCIECDFSCVYGLSMKHGKGQQKRRHQGPQPATNGNQPIAASAEQKYEDDLQQSFTNLLESIGSTANVPTNRSWPGGNNITAASTTQQSPPSTAISSGFADTIWNDAFVHSHTGTFSAESMSPTNHGPANGYLRSLDDPLLPIPNADFSHSRNSEPPNSLSSPSSSVSPIPSNRKSTLLQQPPFNQNLETHDCYVIANSTLTILHGSPRLISSDCASDASSTSSSNPTAGIPIQVVQHLGEILRCTSEATGNMFQLLSCPCANDPQMAMLDASIIIRILFWHQLAAGVNTQDSVRMPSLDGPSFMDSLGMTGSLKNLPHRSSCFTSMAYIAPEPFRIGEYEPDQEDQGPMRRAFLLISLKKLGRLIDTFADMGDAADAGLGGIRVMLGSWLKSELSQTIKVVGNGGNVSIGQQS